MNESIGVKGGKNDRRRFFRISKKQKKKLQEYEKDRDLSLLEEKVKKRQIITFLGAVPIVLIGSAVKNLYDIAIGKKKVDLEEDSKCRIKEYNDIISKSPIEKESKKKKIIPNNAISEPIVDISHEKQKSSDIDLEELPDHVRHRLQRLQEHKIIDVYEGELKDIRYELRQLSSDYQVLAEQEEEIIYSEEADEILQKLSGLIGRIEELKSKIQIQNIEAYDDNYIYTLIEDYLFEFRNGNSINEVEDSPLYVLIAEKLNELDLERDSLEEKVERKKESLKEREEDFEDLRERFFSIEAMNQKLLQFQNEQDALLRELHEKIKNAVTVEEKVRVEVQAMNRQSKNLLRLLSFQMMFPGARGAKRLAATAAAYLYFASGILHPQTTTRRYRVITVKDYSREMENNMKTIEDAHTMLERTTHQVDKMIDEVYTSFQEYIGVVPECDQLLSNLEQIKSDLKEKEYEMVKIQKEQEKLMEQNDVKVMKRGEYSM